ncbi:MAG TPA: heme-binding protein [Candidatus Binatia bacterium]|nr:heme-binding protein [Candidatus Binatia bacterium]
MRAVLAASVILLALARVASSDCAPLPGHATLREALAAVVRGGKDANGGLGNAMWAAVVDRDGIVCTVVFSGPDRGAQWPGSRLIAAEKASTANALSGPSFALSTANLFAGSQPGESLFGLTANAPPNPAAVFAGDPNDFGQPNDPMVGKPIGGMVVFGGGLALYAGDGKIVGGLGVSGDTSCTDHVIAWKLRHALRLDAVPMGVARNGTDNMVLDLRDGRSLGGFGHPSCKGGKPADEIIEGLPEQYRIGPK